MEDKIILKFKTKNILNFYEIEPWCILVLFYLEIYEHVETFALKLQILKVFAGLVRMEDLSHFSKDRHTSSHPPPWWGI